MITIGKKAPDFILTSGTGKRYSLKDFSGRRVVLYFYPKDNTSGCTQEARSFEAKKKILEKHSTVIVGVSADSPESHAAFAEKHALTFPLLSDEKKKVLRAYGVWKKKSMYGKKYFGIERTTVIIDGQGIVRHIFHRVKVDGHTREIMKVLKRKS